MTLAEQQRIENAEFEISQLKDALNRYKFQGSQGWVGNQTLQSGYLQSSNFVQSSSGFRLTADGIIYAVGAVIAGAISASTIDIGGADATSFHVDINGNMWLGDAAFATAPAKISNAGAGTFSSITITGGSITGTPIASIPNNSSTDISLLDFTHDLVFSLVAPIKSTVQWAAGTLTFSNGRTFSISLGNTGAMAAKTYIYLDTALSSTVLQTTTVATTAMGANKKLIAVAQNGSAEATFQVNTGIGGLKITEAMTSISNNDWQFSGAWTITGANQVNWGAGTLTTSNGGSYSITGSNTGAMTLKTYIYFDLGASSTAFATTTTSSTAIGAGKILIAIAQNATGEAKFIVMNDQAYNIDAANIVAGSITANEIAASTITGANILTMNISGKNATFDTGTVGGWTMDASKLYSIAGIGGIVLNSSSSAITLGAASQNAGYINMGAATDPLTGDGVYLGYDQSGTYNFDFRCGDPTGTYMHFDDSASTLNIVGGSLNVGTTGNVRGGSTDYLTTTGFFLGYSGAAHKFSVGNPAGNYIAWDGAAFVVNGFVLSTKGSFGGNGADGALTITSGTTTIDLEGAAFVVKNYTSISITSTGKLAFSNPHANGTTIILKSQGNVTITSTATCIDASGMGAVAGVSTVIATGDAPTTLNGANGTNGTAATLYRTNGGLGSTVGVAGAGGAVATQLPPIISYSLNKYPYMLPGAGGAGGQSNKAGAGTGSATGAAGGRGGAILIIECAGAWNFTTASGISVAGKNGSNGSSSLGTSTGVGGGGGGGGAGGTCIVLYNTLTANSGTIVVSKGTGGTRSTAGTPDANSSGSGGGGGSLEAAGSNGSHGGSGGDGADGSSYVALNTFY